MDDLVLRDKSSERLYSMQDANWNVVAIADATAVVQERYAYSPYGVPVFLTPTFTSRATSSFTWQRLFTGQTYDTQTGLHYFRNRMLHSQVGAFITRDPIGYGDGMNLYRPTFIIKRTDALGTDANDPPTGDGLCTITIECAHFAIPGAGPRHCGLRLNATGLSNAASGEKLYHVENFETGECSIRDRKVYATNTEWGYYDVQSFKTDSSICKCIDETATALNAAALPYFPTPSNDPCGGTPRCNSNYTTKCLLSHCGITSGFDTQMQILSPVGWNHRMAQCTDTLIIHGGNEPTCACACLKWRTVDDAWCSPRSYAQVAGDAS